MNMTQNNSLVHHRFSIKVYFECTSNIYYIIILQIPILVVGTKLDSAEEVRTHFNRRPSPIAEECGADEIFVVMQ